MVTLSHPQENKESNRCPKVQIGVLGTNQILSLISLRIFWQKELDERYGLLHRSVCLVTKGWGKCTENKHLIRTWPLLLS